MFFVQSSALNAGVTDAALGPWLPGSGLRSTFPVELVALGTGDTGAVDGDPVALADGDGDADGLVDACTSARGSRSLLVDFDADALGCAVAVADPDVEGTADVGADGAG